MNKIRTKSKLFSGFIDDEKDEDLAKYVLRKFNGSELISSAHNYSVAVETSDDAYVLIATVLAVSTVLAVRTYEHEPSRICSNWY